jgi:hypothetical protein
MYVPYHSTIQQALRDPEYVMNAAAKRKYAKYKSRCTDEVIFSPLSLWTLTEIFT